MDGEEKPKLRRRARPISERDKIVVDTMLSPLGEDEVERHAKVLRLFGPEVREVYGALTRVDLQRACINFLKSMKEEVLDGVEKDPQIAVCLTWLIDSGTHPLVFGELGWNLPLNPIILGDRRKFLLWVRWVIGNEIPKD